MSTPTRESESKSVLRVVLALDGCPPGRTLAQIVADVAPLSERSVRRILKRLRGRGKVQRCKASRAADGVRADHYYLTAPTGLERELQQHEAQSAGGSHA